MFTPVLFEPHNLTVTLNIALLVIVSLILLYALLSIFRKALPQIIHFAVYLIIMIVGIFIMKPLANWLGNYDLSSLNQSISYNGESIPVTTLLETIRHLLESVAKNEGENTFLFLAVTNGDVATYIEGLSLMLVAYITFFIYSLLAIILCWPIFLLIYHCGFKFIFKKEQRKYKYKRKWKSFAIGFVSATVSFAILLSPFTALVNSINYGVQKNKTQEGSRLDPETYDNYISWIDAYNDSLFAKLLFGNKGKSLDIILMDYTTRMDFNGEELLFSDQISTIADTAEKLIALGLISQDGGGFKTSALFGEGVISSLIRTITDSQFMMKVIPVLVNIAMNYAEVNNILDTEKLSPVADLDWKKQLQQISDIYEALYRAGLVDNLVNDEKPEISLPTNKDEVYTAFDIIDESELFQTVIPAILYTYVTKAQGQEKTEQNLDILSYISSDWNDYKSIKWGSELRIFYDTLLGLKDLGVEFSIKKSKAAPKQKIELKSRVFHTGFMTNRSTQEEQDDNNTSSSQADALLNLLFGEKSLEAIKLITGYDVDTDDDWFAEEKCIFDSNILMNLVKLDQLLPDVITQNLKDENGNSYIEISDKDQASIQKELNSMQKEQEHKKIKKEFAYILRFASYILDENKINLKDGETILENPDSRQAISDAAPYLDKSFLLSTVAPSLFENALKDVSFGDDIPLKGSDLNFRNIKFADEIPGLLKAYEKVMNISEAMSEEDLSKKLELLKPTELGEALKLVKDSKILNPGTNNDNLKAVLDVIFNNEEMKKMGIYSNTSKDELYEIYKRVDQTGWNSEIDAIVDVFTQIKEGDFVKLLTSEGNISLNEIETKNIKELFRSIDGSILLKNTFGSILDCNLKSALQIDEDLNGITFENVTSWEDEAACFIATIEGFKKFSKTDLSEISWLDENPEDVRDLIQAVANMHLFQGENENYFGAYIHRLLTKSGALQEYLKDYPSNGEVTYKESEEDFKKCIWKQEGKTEEKEETEVDHIVQVIISLQEIGQARKDEDSSKTDGLGTIGLNALTSGDMSDEELKTIVDSLSESDALRMVAINGISDALKGTNSPLKLNGVNLNDINIQYLVDANKEERKTELDNLVEIYKEVKTLGLNETESSEKLAGKTIQPLLEKLHNSYLFNSFESEDKNTDKNRTDLTVFEQMIQYMFVETNVLDYVTESKTEDERKTEFKDIILSIGNDLNGKNTNIEEDEDGWTVNSDGDGEIQRIQNIVDNLSDVENLEEDLLSKLTTKQLYDLLNSMNYSRLAHKAVYKFYDTALEKTGFKSFLNQPDLLNYHLNGYSGDILLGHENEISLFVSLIDAAVVGHDEDGKAIYFEFGNKDIKDFIETKDELGKYKSSKSFFDLLFESNVIRYYSTTNSVDSLLAPAEILYNIIEKSNNAKYISGNNKEERTARIMSFFKEPYNMNASIEAESMDKILRRMDASITGSFEDLTSNSDYIKDIMKFAYNPKDLEIANRAYLTSEIVANYLKAFDPTQKEADVDRRIVWIKPGEVIDGRQQKDDFRVTDVTANQIQSLFNLKKGYTDLTKAQTKENEDNFIAYAKAIDTRKNEDGAMYDEVLGKLMYSMFDNTICEEKYNFTMNVSGFSIPLPEMTLNAFFAYENDAIPGLEKAATTYEEKAQRIKVVADQLN